MCMDEIVKIDPVKFAKAKQHTDIRQAVSDLPAGHSFVGIIELRGELLLGQLAGFAQKHQIGRNISFDVFHAFIIPHLSENRKRVSIKTFKK